MWEVRSEKESRVISGCDVGDLVIPFTEWRTPKRRHQCGGRDIGRSVIYSALTIPGIKINALHVIISFNPHYVIIN